MPFEAGATAMDPFVLQRAIEDFSVETDGVLQQQHDPQGRHTAITAESIGSTDGGSSPLAMTSGLRMLYGPLLIDGDNVPTDQLTGVVRADTLASNQNDWNPPGLAQAIAIEMEASAPITITGLESGSAQARRLLLLVNRGGQTITLPYNSGSSLSRNRFGFAGGTGYELVSGDALWLYYDPGAPGWRGVGQSVKQVRYAFVQAVTWSSGGGPTQNFTFGTTLTDYTKAHCFPMVGPSGALTCVAYASSNSNMRIEGLPTGSGDYTVVVNVIEYMNLG